MASRTRNNWTRYVVYRTERTTATWTFRLACAVTLLLVVVLTKGWWAQAVAQSLICQEDRVVSDALLLENFDQDYLLFERAAQLQRAGFRGRVLVPTGVDAGSGRPNQVAAGVVDLMAGIARLHNPEIVPIPEIEPISLNAGYAVRDFLTRQGIHSVTVVTPLFRSRRSALVYGATLGPAGITVRCSAVRGNRDPRNWTQTWHGMQEVGEQWLKLQYYRLYVMPLLFDKQR